MSGQTWIYDARTNVPGNTKRDRPLTPAHFAEFEKCHGANLDGQAKRMPGDSREDWWRACSDDLLGSLSAGDKLFPADRAAI